MPSSVASHPRRQERGSFWQHSVWLVLPFAFSCSPTRAPPTFETSSAAPTGTPPAAALGHPAPVERSERLSRSPSTSSTRTESDATPTTVGVLQGGERAVRGSQGIVVAVEAEAARAGVDVLERGGNAVDAAVATLLALTVTHPSAASLGGGGFALVRVHGAPTRAVDFREVAPRGLTRASFESMLAQGARGPAAVGVPGTVAGIALMHRTWGRLPFAGLVEPALRLAREGHVLGRWQARLLVSSLPNLRRDAAARAVFSAAGRRAARGSLGSPPAAERWVQRDLAWSLQRLASAGPGDFYEGQLAEKLARAVAPNGPSREDLAAYRALFREPLSLPYAGRVLETMPPPSAGGVALVGLLSLLDGRPLARVPESAAETHWFLEASRRAQAERRSSVRDPDSLSSAEQSARRSRWLSPDFWLARRIDPERVTASETLQPSLLAGPAEGEHTTHVSVVDREGSVVSLTTTLSASFGAQIVATGTGIVLNNAVASFSSSGENQPVGSRRTVSSMAPSLLLDGEHVVAVLGTPGGDSIPSTLAQILRNLVDYRWPLERAIDARRWHHGFVPDEALYENATAPEVELLRALKARGHTLRALRRALGDANCIVLNGSDGAGYADPREFGSALAARAAP